MTPKRSQSKEGTTVRLGWQDMVKLTAPIVITILTAAIGLYVKVEVSSAITASRLSAVEEAVKRLPSSEQLEAFRVISSARMDGIEDRLRRLEGHRGSR